MNLTESLRRAFGHRRCVIVANVSPAGPGGQRMVHMHLPAPSDGSGFTDEEVTLLREAAPMLAERFQEAEAELVGLSSDGRVYVLLLPRNTTSAENVLAASAEWLDSAMKRIGSSLEVVDGPTWYLHQWRDGEGWPPK